MANIRTLSFGPFPLFSVPRPSLFHSLHLISLWRFPFCSLGSSPEESKMEVQRWSEGGDRVGVGNGYPGNLSITEHETLLAALFFAF